MSYVKVGDVLRTPSGKLRIVRKVSRNQHGQFNGAGFVILNCSWTKRPVTYKIFTELLDWEHTGTEVELTSAMDAKIAIEMECRGLPKLSCCDVKGIC